MKFWHSLPCSEPKFHFGTPLLIGEYINVSCKALFYSVLILIIFPSVFIFSFAFPMAYAQITLDGTFGRTGVLAGPNYEIKADMGRQSGNNLFHSFNKFNINTNESATFTGPESVENIISRVTGGNVSRIDGFLKSEIP